MMSQSARSRALMLRAVVKAVPASAPSTAAFRAPFQTRTPAHPALENAENAVCRRRDMLSNSLVGGSTHIRAMSILASGFETPKIFRGLERKEQRGMAKKGKKGGKGGDDGEDGGKKKKGGKKGKGQEEEEGDEIVDVEAEVSKIMQELDENMAEVLSQLDDEYSKFRTGRADPRMLDRVRVKQHAVEVALSHVSQVTAPDPKTLTVQVFDPDFVSAVEKALQTSGLDINPIVAGQTIRIAVPKMTQETRGKLAKQAAQLGESSKVKVRRVRHVGLERGNKIELTKDEQKKFEKDVQAVTDKAVKEVDEKVKAKQAQLKGDE